MFKNTAILVIASAMLGMPVAVQAQVTPTAAGKGNTVSADQLVSRYTTLAGSDANAKSLVNGLRSGSGISLIGPQIPEMTTITVTDYGKCSPTACPPTACAPTACLPTACPPTPCPPTVNPMTGQIVPPPPGCTRPAPAGCTVPPAAGCVVQPPAGCTVPAPAGCVIQPAPDCKVIIGTHQEQKPTGRMIDPAPVTFSPGSAAPMGFGNVDIALALTEARLRPTATPTPDQLKTTLLEILSKRAAGEGWGKIAKSYGFTLQE